MEAQVPPPDNYRVKQLDEIIDRMTDNQRWSVRDSFEKPGPGGTVRISTGLGKYTTLSKSRVMTGLELRGLIEDYRPPDSDLPEGWSSYTGSRLTALGRDVAQRLVERKL